MRAFQGFPAGAWHCSTWAEASNPKEEKRSLSCSPGRFSSTHWLTSSICNLHSCPQSVRSICTVYHYEISNESDLIYRHQSDLIYRHTGSNKSERENKFLIFQALVIITMGNQKQKKGLNGNQGPLMGTQFDWDGNEILVNCIKQAGLRCTITFSIGDAAVKVERTCYAYLCIQDLLTSLKTLCYMPAPLTHQ